MKTDRFVIVCSVARATNTLIWVWAVWIAAKNINTKFKIIAYTNFTSDSIRFAVVMVFELVLFWLRRSKILDSYSVFSVFFATFRFSCVLKTGFSIESHATRFVYLIFGLSSIKCWCVIAIAVFFFRLHHRHSLM